MGLRRLSLYPLLIKRQMGKLLAALLVLLVILCLILAALCLSGPAGAVLGGASAAVTRGVRRRGADPALSPHIVVDTLNLTHWLLRPDSLTPAVIVSAIDKTAPTLKLRHPGRVMYVLKDRESQFNDEAAREAYREAAVRNGIYVYVVERYPDPPAGVKPSAEHSSRARDDFFTALLAFRWRCAVLTEDRLRDFDRFRATVSPFHVYEFAFWREQPHRDFIRPESPAYARLRRPKLVRYATYFGRDDPPRGAP